MNHKATRNDFDNAAAREMLRAADEIVALAPLPEDKQNFRIHTNGGWFSRTFFITFQASASSIGNFLSESKGINLSQTETEFYSSEYQLICFDSLEEFKRAKSQAWQQGQKLDLCVSSEYWPNWWKPEIRDSGRKITTPHGGGMAEIYINDKTNRVYMIVNRS